MPRILDSFYEQVYSVVEQIPCGKVLSYKSVAILSGYPQYARQVGYALKVVPRSRDIPCHRVVNNYGRLVPHWAEQKELLLREGVVFMVKGNVDMKKSAWLYNDMEDIE